MYPHAAQLKDHERELRAFQKVHLKPGETKTIQFALPASELAFYNEMMERKTEPGRYQVWVAPNSAGGAQAEFEVVTPR